MRSFTNSEPLPDNGSLDNLIQSSILVFFIVFALSLAFSKSARFFMKYTIFHVWFGVLAIVCVPLFFLSPGSADNSRWAGFFTRLTAKHMFGLKMVVEGWEHLTSEETYIIVCNHQSSVDNLGMMEVIPRNMACMMKKSLKYAGPFGLAAILCGTIFVDRSNPEKAKQAIEEAAKILKRKKIKLWMFPEGHRKLNKGDLDTEHMMPFKKGAFNLAVHAQIPIVPIVFSSQEAFFSFKHRRFTKGVQKIEIMPPIPTSGLTLDDVADLTDRTRDQMIRTFIRISDLDKTINHAKTNGVHFS